MEQNNQWVEDRLSKLEPETEWQPHVTTALARFEKRRARARFIGTRAILAAIVAVICLATFPAPRAFAQRMIAPCVEACESLVMSPGDYGIHHLFWSVHRWLHLAPPDDLLTDANGARFRLSDYTGKVVLLNFWATWCVPCQKEIPWFVEFQRDYAKDGLAVVGISLDDGGWKAVRPVVESQKINYRVAMGGDVWAKEIHGVDFLPVSFLLDRKGLILVKHVGIVSKSDYEGEIVRAIGRD
jgi:cytochrome c biogenesis protein CcmG/thiol:disulfide interchange protein DsbE